MARDLRAVRLGARLVSGVVAIAVAGAAIAGASLIVLPRLTATPSSMTISPVPTDARRACAGPFLALQSEDPASNVAPVSQATVATSAGSGGTAPSLTPLTAANPPAATAAQVPQLVSVPAAGSTTAPEIAAAQSEYPSTETLGGYAASACGDASSDSWLVAGSTTVGSTSMISLVNPDSVAAEVNLAVWAETGAIEAPGSQGIEVAPGSQKVIQLAALAPNVAAPVVHVQTTGGRVVASLQQSLVSGVTPQGVEIAGPTATPALRQTIPGVQIDSLQQAQSTQTGDGYDPYLPALRVLNTGTKATSVRVGITPVGGSGATSGSSMQVTANPGVVSEVPLNGVGNGEYTVTVDADQPVVASARTFAIGKASTDFAWFGAAQALPAAFAAAVAPGRNAFFVFTNPTSTTVQLKITGPGLSKGLTVAAGTSTKLPVSNQGAYAVSGAAGLFADIGYASNGVSSSYLISPPGALASPVRIYPH